MLTLNKNISITSAYENKNNITLPLKSFSSLKKDLFYDSKANHFKIKNKDLIQVSLIIKNDTNSNLDNLTLTIIEDSVFEYIPCSLINTDTKETYLSDLVNNTNIMKLPSLKTNTIIPLQFYIKIHLENLDFSMFNNSISLLNINSTNYTSYPENIVVPCQSALNVTVSPSKNSIKFENIGSAPCENILYHHIVPKNITFDINNLKYTFENFKCNISAMNIDNHILFQIDSLPESNLENTKSLKIEFNQNNTDYFLKHSCSLK